MYQHHISRKTAPVFNRTPVNRLSTPANSYAPLSNVVQRAHRAEPIQTQKTAWFPKFECITDQMNRSEAHRAEPIQTQKTAWFPKFECITDQMNRSEARRVEPIQMQKTAWFPKFECITDQMNRFEARRVEPIQTKKKDEAKTSLAESETKDISTQSNVNLSQVNAPVQKQEDETNNSKIQTENKTGLPDKLKAGIENLSGIAMDDVRVHYNSSKPSQLNALAYAQGTDIHMSPGQERHLPHEAWHVVQQKQGLVKPTMQMKGEEINDDEGLEREADVMGSKAAQDSTANHVMLSKTSTLPNNISSTPIQRLVGFEIELSVPTMGPAANATDPRFLKSCPASVEQFLTKGLAYGRNDLGNNPNFRLSADHNELVELNRAVFNQLHTMGYAPEPFGNSLSNLEYETEALDELAPNSTTAFRTKFNAISGHINSLFPAVTNNIIAVPYTNNVYAGIPVDDFQTWLGEDYNQIQPQIQAVQNATQRDRLYLQATAGIIPSALPDLFGSMTQRPAVNRYQYISNVIEDFVTALFNENDIQNHDYVTDLQANHPVDYEALRGVLFLIVAYLVGNALNKTTFIPDDSTSKNAVSFLSQTRLHRVMSEAAPTFLRNNPLPDELIDTIQLFLIYRNPSKPKWWLEKSALRNQLQPRNTRGDLVHGADSTFIGNTLRGEEINLLYGMIDGEFETPSPHNFNPDVQQAQVRNASEDQQGIPLEFRRITQRPNANGLPNALMAIVNQVRQLNTKHMSPANKTNLISAADR